MKIKRCLMCIVLVASYVLGTAVIPTHANNGYEAGIESLLEESQAGAHKGSEKSTVPSATVRVSISDFADVKQGDWFYPYLEYLVGKGAINGKTQNSFEPYSTFSYAECSAVIVRYLGLEDESKRRQSELVASHAELKNQWYVGYFETLSVLGLFNDYDLFELSDGRIVSVNKELANSPIVRYRFAESISKSFELRSELKAKNVYSEIGGSGREFIIGGAYNKDILEKYKEKISDFSDIPESSAEYVLKAYYNGIFNGDTSGNFYPHNNLTRGEMAKVLATVFDYSLRTRLITEGYGEVVTENMLHTDAFGKKTLKFEEAQRILLSEAQGISMLSGSVIYRSGAKAPIGYAIDVYLYQKNGAAYSLVQERTLHDRKSDGFTYYAPDSRVLLVLRNVENNSEVEGVLDIVVTSGQIASVKPLIREI